MKYFPFSAVCFFDKKVLKNGFIVQGFGNGFYLIYSKGITYKIHRRYIYAGHFDILQSARLLCDGGRTCPHC